MTIIAEFDRLYGLLERKRDVEGLNSNAMLKLFFEGYPVEGLNALLAGNDNLKFSGAWIASELGAKASKVKCRLIPLLGHSDRYIRYFSIDSLQNIVAGGDEYMVLMVLKMMEDPDSAVRVRAMQFACSVSSEHYDNLYQNSDAPELRQSLDLIVNHHAKKYLLEIAANSHGKFSNYAIVATFRKYTQSCTQEEICALNVPEYTDLFEIVQHLEKIRRERKWVRRAL